MIVFYITGTSSGIGRALAEKAARIQDSRVYGFSRTPLPRHDNLIHTAVDLSLSDEVSRLPLVKHPEAGKVVLINSAGDGGELKPVGRQADESIARVFLLNTICPAILSNRILGMYAGLGVPIIIINISSGAGRRPVEGWAPYCASKAALDMLSRVVQAEHGSGTGSIRVFSVAPGIVDTNLQRRVRASNSSDFPNHERFVGYHTNGQLASPESVAQKILGIVDRPADYQEVLLDFRQT